MEDKINIPDMDLDVSSQTREAILSSYTHIPASKINEKGITPHGIGVYFCGIPQDKITGLASIDYKRAEDEFGYIKIDLLHNTIYDSFNNREEIEKILEQEPDWSKLYKQNIVEQLPHINSYYTLINSLPKIDSVEKLAMLLALIRPAKSYLIDDVKNNGWESIEDKIWVKEDKSKGYMYKKSHSIAYALSIIVAMNKFL